MDDVRFFNVIWARGPVLSSLGRHKDIRGSERGKCALSRVKSTDINGGMWYMQGRVPLMKKTYLVPDLGGNGFIRWGGEVGLPF